MLNYRKKWDIGLGSSRYAPLKIPIAMKLSLAIPLLFTSVFQVNAFTFGQSVTLEKKSVKLSIVLKDIQRQSGYNVFYNEALINKEKRVDVSLKNVHFKKALETVLDDYELDFKFVDKNVILTKRAQSASSARVENNVTQKRSITGTITDQEGNSLANVTVTEKGTTNKVASQANGRFAITVNDQNALLQFSNIGFLTKEIAVHDKTDLQVSLTALISDLDEVVVVGYGTQKKSDLTGAVASVQSKDFTQGANTNALQLLSGKAPGVSISQTNSAPGAGTKIQIRGAGSINSSNDALIVVDGLPGIDPASLSPDDIESIDVLKDASAAAIYGTRAANGVVLITTKKGKSGISIAKYDNYIGLQNVSKKLDVLNGRQYMETLNALRREGGKSEIYTQEQVNNMGRGTNWQDEIFRSNAPVHSHQLSFSGGGETSTFYTALNYFSQDGLVKQSAYDKLNFRTNLEFRPKDYVKFNINANYTRGKQNAILFSNGVNEGAGPINSALQFDPTLSAGMDENGRYYLNSFIALDNPLALINGITNDNLSNTFYGVISTEIKPFDGFTTTLRFGGSTAENMNSSYTDRSTINGLGSGGIGSKNASSGYQWLAELITNYQRRFGEHDFNIMAGTTFEEFQSEGVGASSKRFLSDVTSYNLLQSGDGDKSDNVNSSKSRNRLHGVLGRVNYSFKDKYLVTASLRSDGTSRFSQDHKYALFPSGAVAWKLTEEPFLSNLKDQGYNLKLRLGYGKLGNQSISNYQTINTLVASGNAVFGNSIYQGVVSARLPNRDLRWESTEEINAAVDFELFRGRITGSVDFFKRNTKDQLFSKPIPSVVGYSSYMVNFGDVENRGVDFQLTTKNIIRDNWSWNSLFNLSLLKNEVKELPDFIPQLITGSLNGFITNYQLVEKGHPMLSFYGFETEGIFQLNDDIANSAQPNAKPGHIRFKDQNGDGKIDKDDRTILGSPFPTITVNLSNSFSYKRMSFDFLLQYVGGISMLDANVFETLYPTNEYRNRLTEYYVNRWTPENPTDKYPSGVNPTSYGGDYTINSLTVQDASFLRLKNVNFSYEVFNNAKAINRLNVFLSIENLATWTPYKGYDPEASATGTSSTSKVSYNSYPLARTFRLGINVTL